MDGLISSSRLEKDNEEEKEEQGDKFVEEDCCHGDFQPRCGKRKAGSQHYTLLSWPHSERRHPGGQLALLSTYLYGAFHGGTDQLLPASFKALEKDLGLSPLKLGYASSCARIAHAVTCPLWGLAADYCGRKKIFVSTAVGWGLACVLFAFVSEGWHLVPLLFCTGCCMAAMGPLSQKILAEEVEPQHRGAAFGTMQLFQSLARMVSLMATTTVSGYRFIGAAGWRYAFGVSGALSVCLGLCLGTKLLEPRNSADFNKKTQLTRRFSAKELHYVFASGSLWSMLLMGLISGIPRSALGFSTMWLQYCGISDWWASFIVAASWAAAIAVAPVVGCATDYAAWRSPNHGRTFIAQAALLARASLMAVMLTCIPTEPYSFWKFTLLAVLIGLLAGWPGVGVNRPILSEIAEPQHRATFFAATCTCESIGGALFGAPLVGYLSEHAFGYRVMTPSSPIADLPHGERTANAKALGLSMLCMTAVPWVVNVILYCILHATYKTDRRLEGEEHAVSLKRRSVVHTSSFISTP